MHLAVPSGTPAFSFGSGRERKGGELAELVFPGGNRAKTRGQRAGCLEGFAPRASSNSRGKIRGKRLALPHGARRITCSIGLRVCNSLQSPRARAKFGGSEGARLTLPKFASRPGWRRPGGEQRKNEIAFSRDRHLRLAPWADIARRQRPGDRLDPALCPALEAGPPPGGAT